METQKLPLTGKKFSSVGLKCLSRKATSLQVFEFKSHTLGELLEAIVLREHNGKIIQVLKVFRNEGREMLTSWEHENASHDLCKKLNDLMDN